MTQDIRRVTIVGAGVIGANWSALFLSEGLDAVATDVAAVWPALTQLGLALGASCSPATVERKGTKVALLDFTGPKVPQKIPQCFSVRGRDL
jgi:3-hydroxyacyl-CoA dehydrogenase